MRRRAGVRAAPSSPRPWTPSGTWLVETPARPRPANGNTRQSSLRRQELCPKQGYALSAMSDPVKHHYVPQLYLRRFANERQQLQVTERAPPHKSYKSHVRDVASERLFYRLETESGPSLELEKALSQLESEFHTSITNLTTKAFPPSADDREVMSFFIALQWLRGRDQRDSFAKLYDQFMKVVLVNTPRTTIRHVLEQQLGREPTEAEVEKGIHDLKTTSAYRVTPGNNTAVVQVLSMAPGLGRVASSRTWQLLRFPSPCLLTSDSPVVTWTHPKNRGGPFSMEGFGMCDEIRIPLDSQHVLIVARDAPAGEITREGTPEQAKALNYSVASNGYLRIFHHPDLSPLDGLPLPPPFDSRFVMDGPVGRILPDDA